MDLSYASEFWRLIRFSIVGAISTGVYVVTALITISAIGVSPILGASFGFCASFLVSYLAHFHFTFNMQGRYRDYVVRFAVSSLVSFLISTTTIWVTTNILKIDYRVALIAVAIIIPICNYIVNRFWVFLHPTNVADTCRQPLETV